MTRPPTSQVRAPRGLLIVALLIAAAIIGPLAIGASATETDEVENQEQAPGDEAIDPEAEEQDEALRQGAAVYSQTCSSCHQAGGAGVPEQFPPLIDNPRVDDAMYMADVIVGGQRGEIEVAGVTYDGVMPPFSTLSDEDVAAVIAYIQNDFMAPQTAIDAFDAAGPSAGSKLPPLASFAAIIAYLLAAGLVAMVLAPRFIGVNDRLATPWLDAWLKSAMIVVAIVFLTVVVPNWALKTLAVSKLSRFGQDLVGSGLWALGLTAVIVGLWYAHRESRI